MKHRAHVLNTAILVLILAAAVAAQSTEIEKLRLAAEQGDAVAQSTLGVMYANGQGVPQDYQEAVRWGRRAAEQGNADAQIFLGGMYWIGQGVPQDCQEGVQWFGRAAEQGDARAQMLLGGMYYKGSGSEDYQEAQAQYNLNFMYCWGEGVPQDYQEALKWNRAAAEQGNAEAQSILCAMYYKGQGVPQDYQEALKWCWTAAEQGEDYAQSTLGGMYFFGQGVRKNDVQAHKWFNLAASRTTPGKEESYRSMRDTLAVTMTASQLAEAQRLAREWEPKTWEQLKDE